MEEGGDTKRVARRESEARGGVSEQTGAAGLSRRSFLQRGALGAPAAVAALSLDAQAAQSATTGHPGPSPYARVVPCYGRHQAGVTTAQQSSLVMAAFDLTVGDRRSLVSLLRTWQDAIAALTEGRPLPGYGSGGPASATLLKAPVDTGESDGQGPEALTMTIGFGASLFDRRFGLAGHRPSALVDLPAFRHDALEAQYCGGDLTVQVCANTRTVAEHAVRCLVRLAGRSAVPRWTQIGFVERPTRGGSSTPRNMMGFRDGTANLDASDPALMNCNVWVQPGDGPAWMTHGSYQVFRRIEIDVRKWDESSLDEQQKSIGRYKASGAPFGGRHEFDPVHVAAMAPDAHVRLSNPRSGAASARERILRRGFSFYEGYGHHSSAPTGGLQFICFQRDPRTQFVTIQRRLDEKDHLHEYLTHTGSAVSAIPPGARAGGYVGQTLLEG